MSGAMRSGLIRIVQCVCMLLLCAPGVYAAPAQSLDLSPAEKRVALVIGNGGYRTSPLKNPVNDATDIADNMPRLWRS